MEFRVLGPLMVHRAGSVVDVPHGKQRVLLAALLLRPNSPVSTEELADALWGVNPPATARVTLQNYVKRLRQASDHALESRISSQPGRYLISVAPGELDTAIFE